MKDYAFYIFMAVCIVLSLGVNGYLQYKCWNIPIAERSGMCALLH